MEWWSNGVVEDWKDGRMEDWEAQTYTKNPKFP
jgi:hypothetical protein